MLEQAYHFSVLYIFSPIFFVYLYFIYDFGDLRPSLTQIALSSVVWAIVWPIVIAIAIHRKLKNG